MGIVQAAPESTSMSSFVKQLAELRERQWFRAGLNRLKWHVDNPEFRWHHQEGGKLPRNHLWRPYRFSVQDVVLGVTVLRHRRDLNCLEVDVFLTASIPEYESDSGVRALSLLLLSEAYKAGGSMEVRFTEYVEGGNVPEELVVLAQAQEIALTRASEGIITSREARRLFVALTGFSPGLRDRIDALEQAGRLSSPLTCYAVQQGLWERVEVEAILQTCPRPESLLSGQAPPEQRHLYLHDLLYGRMAVLFGHLDRYLRFRTHQSAEATVLLEDDERNFEMTLDGASFAATYICLDEDVAIPWVFSPGWDQSPRKEHVARRGQPFTVLIRPHDATGLVTRLAGDFRYAAAMRGSGVRERGHIYLLVPRDFEKLSVQRQQALLSNRPEGVDLMVYRDFVSGLDDDVARRLRSSRVLRS